MIFRHEYEGGVWVDLEQPTENEIRQVAREFSVNERIEREMLAPTPVPTTITDDGMVLLVLHFPTQGVGDGETKSQEVDFVVGKDFILTVRYEVVAPLHHLKKLLEAQQLVTGKVPIATDTLLEILFVHLYTAMRDHTNHVAGNLARVEKDMFDGHERTTVRAISNISREFLHPRQSEFSLGHPGHGRPAVVFGVKDRPSQDLQGQFLGGTFRLPSVGEGETAEFLAPSAKLFPCPPPVVPPTA